MKKQILSVILGIAMAMSMSVSAAFANTADGEKRIEITEQAVANLIVEKLDAAVEMLNSADVNQSMRQLSDGSQYGIQTYDLGDGCQMTVELRDQADGVQAGAAMPLAVTGEWKAYGNRYFTAKTTVTVAGYSATLGLENHYVLSSNGIDENYGVPIGTPGDIKVWIEKGDYIIEDGAARTPGASDVNMYCTFTCKASSTTSKYKLDTAVQYLAHDTIGKRIKVGHTWKLTKLA